MHTLIVDQDYQTLIDEILEYRPNWNMIGVSTPTEALHLIHRTNARPDMVIAYLDPLAKYRKTPDAIMMMMVLKQISRLEKTRFIILIRTPENRRDNRAAVAGGADAVLFRPETCEETQEMLHLILRRVVQNPQYRQERWAPWYSPPGTSRATGGIKS